MNPVWTIEDIHYRLVEAADTLRRLPMPKNSRPQELRAGWPDMVYEWSAYGYSPAQLRQSPPSPEHISNLDETLGWLHWLDREQRMIVWARANGWTWRKINEWDCRSTPTLRKCCEEGYSVIYRKLNKDFLEWQIRWLSGNTAALMRR